MTKGRTRISGLAAVAALILAGCQQQAKEDAPPPAPAASAGAPSLGKMPISLNATMVGMISASADFLFAVGNGDLPRNEHHWNEVQYHAYQMILGGQIMKIPGTGEGDVAWTGHPEWQSWSQDLTDIGFEALRLSEARNADVASWRKIGDRLVQNCLGCHEKFKPEIPSEGILHEGTRRQSEGRSIFD